MQLKNMLTCKSVFSVLLRWIIVLCRTFLTPETVIKGASYILAKQFSREPSVRRKLREFFRRHLKMSACPTKKGQEIFDYKHPLFGRHYIKDKPVSRLKDEEYLQYVKVGIVILNVRFNPAVEIQLAKINVKFRILRINRYKIYQKYCNGNFCSY